MQVDQTKFVSDEIMFYFDSMRKSEQCVNFSSVPPKNPNRLVASS